MVVNGTTYHDETPIKVIDILEQYRMNRTERLELITNCYSESGYIGRSCGRVKIPILVKTCRSFGGSPISEHRITMIRTARGKRVLYDASKEVR
jgi:hypothetical protein